MNLSTFKISLIGIIISLSACNNVPKDSIFSKLSPTSKEYRNKLANVIESKPEELTYTLNKYLQENGREYLDVQVEGNDFEAKGLVLVNNWNKLEDIKRTKGLGYSGATLKGLKVDIQQNDSGAEFIYKDLEKIVD